MGTVIKETCEENFGTAYETYKQSVNTDNSIILQDVKGIWVNGMIYK